MNTVFGFNITTDMRGANWFLTVCITQVMSTNHINTPPVLAIGWLI
jgi:hypothetical protein